MNLADITAVEFITDTIVNGTATITVDVTFNEAVTVTRTPQLTVANGNQSGDATKLHMIIQQQVQHRT